MSYKVGQQENFHPFDLVVFGGTGDLAIRKIYPALYHRFAEGQLDLEFRIIPINRDKFDEEEFFARVKEFIIASAEEQYQADVCDAFINHISLVTAIENTVAGYAELSKTLAAAPDSHGIFYFSTPSSAFGEISAALKEAKLLDEFSKVVLEKPLGHDLNSSGQVNDAVLDAFQEKQIYRIDHYLGKESVQNLMVLRFANNLFERAWNSEDIDNIQITVAESIGVESRANYYDKSGALRDMVQNHLLQLLCLVAMEPPLSLDADSLRDEKLKVLKALRPITAKSAEQDTIKGQYTRGTVKKKKVASYLEDLGQFDSRTETFVAIKAYVDNWRWKNVPFYMRTGKRMPKRYSDIVINFKPVKHNIFPSKDRLIGNQLIIRLQPEERIELVQMTKIPGPGGYRYKPISLKLDYVDSFTERFPDAYERLIMDVVRGNQTLFMRYDELSAAWKWTESILKSWKAISKSNVLYDAGTLGPGDLLMNKGHAWFNEAVDP